MPKWEHPTLSREAFHARVQALEAETASPLGAGWWLSFIDPDRPKGEQFQGACVVLAENLPQAIRKANFLGLTPGTDVGAMGPFHPSVMERIPDAYMNVLMDADACAECAAIIADAWPEGKSFPTEAP